MKTFLLLCAVALSVPAVWAQDAAAGSKKVAACQGCHGIPGYQASFPEVHKVPKIAGQGAPYIVAALVAYKKGERKHPTMRAVAGSMSDQDMADVAAFYAQLGAGEGAAGRPASAATSAVEALLARGGCVGCHGADFGKPIDPSYPKVAGQHADYLYVALRAYQIEGEPQRGRASPVMGAIAKQFTPAELRQLAAYVATLPGELKTVTETRLR